MPVPDSISYRTLLNNVTMLNQRLARASEQISSGKKVSHLHDAPADSAELLQLHGQLSDLDQYQANADTIGFFLQVSESTLSSVFDLATTAYARGSAAGSNFQDAAARAALAGDIRSLRDQVFSLANTRVRGRYLFSGSLVETAAFAMNGNAVTYQGNAEVNTIDIANNLQVRSNVTGSAAFTAVFAAMNDLLAAVEGGDQAGIKSALGQFTGAFAAINIVRSGLGGDLAKLQDSSTAREIQKVNIQTRQSVIGDADLAAAITDLNRTQTALQAALTAGSLIGQRSLFDYLG